MAVNVKVGSTSVRRVTTSAPTSNVRLKSSVQNPSRTQTATSIDGLQGVDVDGVQNGYTLVYDAASGNWEAAPAADVAANVANIDGGTF
jgi:hypothetical protein